MQHNGYDITTYEHVPGIWRANIRRVDGKTMIVEGIEMPNFASMDCGNEEFARDLAIAAINQGHFKKGN